jgi:hypothetical protein
MKNKHHGFACLIIFSLSFAGIFVYGVFLADKITGTIHLSRPPSVPDIKVPDKHTMEYIDYLTSHLTDLAALKERNSNVDLALFGFKPALSHGSLSIPVRGNEEKVSFSYALTLSFVSLKNSFCIIGGKLYKENGLLPDGGKIEKIENDRVSILKHKKKQWIYPLQQRKVSKGNNEEAI